MLDPLSDDLDLMYAAPELSDRVQWAGEPFLAHLDVADLALFDGRSQGAQYTLRYPAGEALAVNTEVVIRGRRYQVTADPERINDGRELIAPLWRIA